MKEQRRERSRNHPYVEPTKEAGLIRLEMSSDTELLRKKRELELRRRMLQQQANPSQEMKAPQKPLEENASDSLKRILTGRGEEVLETARRYYPREISELEMKLGELVKSGRLTGPLSGEELYLFLRRLGLSFSLDIKIRVSEHGKLKTLEEKFRSHHS